MGIAFSFLDKVSLCSPGCPHTPSLPAPSPWPRLSAGVTGGALCQTASTLTLVKVILLVHNLPRVCTTAVRTADFTGSWLSWTQQAYHWPLLFRETVYRIAFSNLILKQVCQERKHSIFSLLLERGQPLGQACIPLPAASIHTRSLKYKFIACQVFIQK